MNVIDAICRRRSIRRYKETVVEQKKLDRILEAARLAPSAANKQPWRFIVIADPEAKEKLRPSYNVNWFIQAPVIIVACGVPKEAWHRRDGEEYCKVDVAIAMQNLVLASTELGLGTCWIAAFDEKRVKKALGIPKDVKVVAMTPLGYPDEKRGPITERKPIDEIVSYNHW